MLGSEFGGYVVEALLILRHSGKEGLQSHIEWCNEMAETMEYEISRQDKKTEAEACQYVLEGNPCEQYLTSEYKGHKVTFVDDNCLNIDGRNIKVKPSREFAYSIKKTQINAINGALGLYETCFCTKSAWISWGWNVCEKAANVKETKTA